MRGTDLLAMQLKGSCDLVASNARDAEDCWLQRALPGTSRPGFVLWHCARIIDWGVHTVVRDVPEIGAAPEWRERIRYDLGHGAGLSPHQADEATETVGAADVAAYAEILSAIVLGWLDGVSDGDLDHVPEIRRASAAANALYVTPAAWAEVESLEGLPAWQVLARPCAAHIRVHIGEFQVLRDALRSGATAGDGTTG
jgi:hypothetical protein